jgi:hypothetical protein
MKYGKHPEPIDYIQLDVKEMMLYQDMPIKFPREEHYVLEERLKPFEELIDRAIADFKNEYGHATFVDHFMYITAKKQFVSPAFRMNRQGWHCDGFLTDDIVYVWSDHQPTIFNIGDFNLTLDDSLSLGEMKEQADPKNNIIVGDNMLTRIDQYVVHKVNDVSDYAGMRTFAKISFSKNKYDLEGNSHNYELDYDWRMRPRNVERNMPQVTK